MFSIITSANNPRVKSATQLRESRARRREGLFLVDGLREVLRAWRSGFEFVEVFWNAEDAVRLGDRVDLDAAFSNLSDEGRNADLRAFLKEVDRSDVPLIPLGKPAFDKLSFGDRDEGVVAVVKEKFWSLDALEEKLTRERDVENALIAIIEGVEKPGNVGAILRSADGAGVGALIIVAKEYDAFNPNAIRGSLGAIFNVPVVVAPAEETLAWLRRLRIQRATALCDKAVSYAQLDYKRPTAIIVGSEAEGLTQIWAEESREDAQFDLLKKVRLPMLGIADSLNVSNAAAVLFYEARRARSF